MTSRHLPYFPSNSTLSSLACESCQKTPPTLCVCACKCRTICIACRNNCDSKSHQERCNQIQTLTSLTRVTVNELRRMVPFGDMDTLFQKNFPDSLRNNFDNQYRDENQNKICRKREVYFKLREDLIKELILEGRSQKSGMAYDIALIQCKELVALQRGDPNLFQSHIHLMRGMIQSAYNASCYHAKNGLNLDNLKLQLLQSEGMRLKNITKSYIQQGMESGKFFLPHEQKRYGEERTKLRNWPALCHIFLVKYLMYMNMESLGYCSERLKNSDCVNLVVEYVGLKKEWIREGHWYREQALEILRLFHIEQTYFGSSQSEHFDSIKEFALHYPSHQQKLICTIIDEGKKHIDNISKSLKLEKQMSTSKWAEIVKGYEQDHNILYTTTIRPFMPELVKLVNSKAGFDVMGMNVDCKLGMTSFLTEGNNACRGIKAHKMPLHNFGNPWNYDDDYNSESMLDFYDYGFTDSFFLCLMIELKLAQLHFYRNRESERVKKVLQQLPDGENLCVHPPNEDQGGDFGDAYILIQESCDKFDDVARRWLVDVTKIVESLWRAGLDDEENLSILFGKKDFVSYIIWTLQEEQQSRSCEGSIRRFVNSHRRWKVGCIDNDKSLGLKMLYLNGSDRRAKFAEIAKLLPLGNAIQGLQPSIEQFISTFGRSSVGIPYGGYFREWMCGEDDVLASKKQKTELDCFATVEEACRYYFDTASLEEAIWDYLGIPRIIALNGSREKMLKLGWVNCGVKSTTLGDKSVQLRQRVVHVYGAECSVWEEL